MDDPEEAAHPHGHETAAVAPSANQNIHWQLQQELTHHKMEAEQAFFRSAAYKWSGKWLHAGAFWALFQCLPVPRLRSPVVARQTSSIFKRDTFYNSWTARSTAGSRQTYKIWSHVGQYPHIPERCPRHTTSRRKGPSPLFTIMVITTLQIQ